MDGRHALQDEAVEKRRHRDGLACSRLQHDPRDEDCRYPHLGRSNEGLKGPAQPEKCTSKRPTDPDCLRNVAQTNLTVPSDPIGKTGRQTQTRKNGANPASFHTASGQSRLMQVQLLPTQHSFAVAADFMLRCSPFRRSRHSAPPPFINFKLEILCDLAMHACIKKANGYRRPPNTQMSIFSAILGASSSSTPK